MKNKKVIIIFLFIMMFFLFVPLPQGVAKDGGTKSIGPISGVYEIIEYNRILQIGDGELKSHADPDYEPPKTRTMKKGTEVKIFGMTVYDGSYEVTENIG
ncbi:MAG: hypothetical protein MJ093_01020 [Saccharofermentans sp.]|nr:hypothetical protein [Saccharofermentans sp.]